MNVKFGVKSETCYFMKSHVISTLFAQKESSIFFLFIFMKILYIPIESLVDAMSHIFNWFNL